MIKYRTSLKEGENFVCHILNLRMLLKNTKWEK